MIIRVCDICGRRIVGGDSEYGGTTYKKVRHIGLWRYEEEKIDICDECIKAIAKMSGRGEEDEVD